MKAASYAHVLDGARSAAAVSAGLCVITYTTCSFTSLGALGMGTVKCLNAAAGYTSRSVRWLLLVQPLGMMVSPPRDFLHCFGSASAVSHRLQSCVATG